MINDPCFNEYEKNLLKKFQSACDRQASVSGIDDSKWNLFTLAEEHEIPLVNFHKEGLFVQAIWISFLSTMRKHLSSDSYKYPNLKLFQEIYAPMLNDGEIDDREQEYLRLTANWMSIMFTMIPARKNKGLVMQVVPKLVEGWQTKYVTGSGQTKATASRVHIFEKEGNITPHHRGRLKPKKAMPAITTTSTVTAKRVPPIRIVNRPSHTDSCDQCPQLKKRRLPSMVANVESIPVSVFLDPINQAKYRAHHARLGLSLDGRAFMNDDECDSKSQPCVTSNTSATLDFDDSAEFDDFLGIFDDSSISTTLLYRDMSSFRSECSNSCASVDMWSNGILFMW